MPVRLAAVEDGVATRAGASRERAFSLLFRGAARPGAGQGTYVISHRELRRFELFVVPVDSGLHGQTYQAIVNRTLG